MSSPSTKYAVAERERRFLLEGVPPGATEPRTVEDRYLDGTRLRLRSVRHADGRLEHKLGQKVRPDPADASVVLHTTCYLSPAEFDVLAALPARTLTKTRWTVRVADRDWAVDVFGGGLAGIVLAEVDVGEGDPASVVVPPWCGREVTDDERWTGGALASQR